MATFTPSERVSLLNLPRELRDEIIEHLAQPDFVYKSRDKPDFTKRGSRTKQYKYFLDTRIYIPYRIPSNVLGVCRQLREECLQYNYNLLSPLPASTTSRGDIPAQDSEDDEVDLDAETERLGDRHLRITIETHRHGLNIREHLSPRLLSLLPFMERSRKLRIVAWAGFDWWNGARPRTLVKVNGRPTIDSTAPARPDAVSFAIGKILEQLPAVEELELDVLANVGDLSRWDLPEVAWANIQYWLDGPIVPNAGQNLRKVSRRLAGVWNPKLVEAIYEQQETRLDGSETWHIKRHGDMRTVSNVVVRWGSY
jgi:hypothetical protein